MPSTKNGEDFFAQDVWHDENRGGLWDAISDAKRLNTKIRIGRLFGSCVEKSSELESRNSEYKGRVVFGGTASGTSSA